jgi:hypothetical protein
VRGLDIMLILRELDLDLFFDNDCGMFLVRLLLHSQFTKFVSLHIVAVPKLACK